MQLFIELVFVLSILGLWTVCEKYRKLMNELAQVADLDNIDPAAAVAEIFFCKLETFLVVTVGLQTTQEHHKFFGCAIVGVLQRKHCISEVRSEKSSYHPSCIS